MTQPLKHWTILGAGAVGHLLACRFAAQKIPAILVHRKDNIKNNTSVTYRFEHTDKQFSLQHQSSRDVQSIHYLILAVKSHQVESAILSIKEKLEPDCQVFLLQNGMGALEKVSHLLKGIISPYQIYPGTNTHGSYLQKNSLNKLVIIHAGTGELIFGANYLSDVKTNQPDCLLTLKQLDLNTRWTSTIERRLWMKLAVNAAINPITAVNFCKNGDIVKSEKLLQQLKSLCLETAQLFKTLSLSIDESSILEEVLSVIQKTANNQSSMLQDIQSGKTTEIEAITGYLLEKARSNKVSLETHKKIYQQIKSQNLN